MRFSAVQGAAVRSLANICAAKAARELAKECEPTAGGSTDAGVEIRTMLPRGTKDAAAAAAAAASKGGVAKPASSVNCGVLILSK
jgi:hypothetical protein